MTDFGAKNEKKKESEHRISERSLVEAVACNLRTNANACARCRLDETVTDATMAHVRVFSLSPRSALLQAPLGKAAPASGAAPCSVSVP